ncbi:hypothetical protein AMECASPLE_027279 [Ameca splendens]|uniref:Uncharacterized protein n=1 Tax=Ameca splendens TaxID=208324 RepID=A0ABV0Z4N5_9TELE
MSLGWPGNALDSPGRAGGGVWREARISVSTESAGHSTRSRMKRKTMSTNMTWLRGTTSRWDSPFCVLRWLLVEADLPGRSVFLLLDFAGIPCGLSIVCFRKCATNHHGVQPI